MCSAAESGQLLISDTTRERLLEDDRILHELAPVRVKGKDAPLTLFRVEWQD